MKDKGSRSLLDIAIEREDWELAALCLLIGVVEAARKYPEAALDALLDELELEAMEGPKRRGAESGQLEHRGSRVRERRERHGRA